MLRWRLWPKRKAPSLGQQGEDLAAQYLKKQGFRIHARNTHVGRYEIDLIAQEGDTLAFVEVKTRRPNTIAPPEANITRTKRRRLRAAGKAYIAANDQPGMYYRFDLIAIVLHESGQADITHYRSAFTLTD